MSTVGSVYEMSARKNGGKCCHRFKGTCGIYWIRNVINGKFYIGSSADIRSRCYNHIKELESARHKNAHLSAAWDKYGPAAFRYEIIEEVENESELLSVEQWYLDNTRCCDPQYGYNLTPTAGRVTHTPESKAKIAAWGKGKKYGPIPEERKEKIAASLRGRVGTNKGKKWTEEQKQRMAEGQKRRMESAEYKARFQTEDHHRKMSDAIKRGWEKRRSNTVNAPGVSN